MTIRKVLAALALCLLLPGYALAAFPADALPTDRGAERGGASAPGDFMLWWDVPRRWYTGIPLSTRISFYEVDNRQITYTLENAPSGMTIDETGLLEWASPTAGTHADIVLTLTRSTCDSSAFASCSLTASQTFTLVVGTSDFKFADDTGTDDGDCGTLADPCGTLSYLIANRLPGGTDGVTVFMRAGTYTDSWAQGSAGILANNYTAADHFVIRNYPGETVTINAAAASGIPLSTSSQYVVIEGVNVTASTAADRGNYVLRGSHIILKDAVSSSATFSGNDNCTGVQVAGADDLVVNRVVSHSNDTALGNLGNVSNFLTYNDSAGDRFVLNSKAYNSNYNFKIKHTNADSSRTILHNFESTAPGTDYSGFVGFGKNSSVRYSVFYNDDGVGMNPGLSDPSSYTVQGMLFEHNTVIAGSSSASAFRIQEDYGTTGTITMYRNIFYQGNGACVGANPDPPSDRRILFVGWYYTTRTTADDYPFVSDYNIWHNTNGDADCFHIGNTGAAAPLTFAQWQAITGGTRDPNSVVVSPELDDIAAGDLDCGVSDNCATDCGSGEFCGALRPGQTYGTFGQSNTTLISFDHSDNSVEEPEPPAAEEDSAIASLINLICRRHHRQ